MSQINGIRKLPPAVILPSLSVDAACSGNPGIMEYRGVDTATGQEIFRQGPFQNGTNNIGEFLALVHALALLKKEGSNAAIYSDSFTARTWVLKRKVKTTLERDSRNDYIFQLLERAISWIQANSWKNQILVWDTKKWGEIPADFGRK
jgi:ribonuclease HI